MGRLALLAVSVGALLVSGCRSAFVAAELKNDTASPLSVVEVDYPSASFGTQSLAPGATFRYRFKILGTGPTKLTYTDSTGHDHATTGPTLAEGLEGTLVIRISPSGVAWEPHLAPAR